MGWAAITAATGDSAPAGGWSSGMHPPFLFCLAKRETGRARSKEKNAWRTPVRWPSVRTGVGVSVRAPILPALRARLGFLRFLGLPSRGGWCSFVGVVVALPLLLFSLPLAVPRGSRCNGRMRASAPTEIPQALRVGADLCVGPCRSANPGVGADALIRPKA